MNSQSLIKFFRPNESLSNEASSSGFTQAIRGSIYNIQEVSSEPLCHAAT